MQETTFWKLITSTDIRRICIPTIQRDYAQGRRDKVYIRKNFLEALKSAIDSDKQLMLDFVYGIENESIFVPLDGQQRLTTLWLLHWYIAYKSEHLNDDDVKNALLKFTYETRVSSSDFCKLLCGLGPLPSQMSMRDWITQQTWFYHQYNQDPTIMGMLNTIAGTDILDEFGKDVVDGLEALFKDEAVDYQSMWTTLTTTDCIKFNKLHISQYDSDELYVKMNARGKQLTDFENFKAELIQYAKRIEVLGEEKSLEFAAKLDVRWTDIFWNNRWEDEKTGDISIDEIYFEFIRRFVRLECINKYKEGEESALIKRISKTFTSFDPYKDIIDKKSIEDFVKIMDNLGNCKVCTTTSPWGEKFNFVPKYKGDDKAEVTTTTNTQLLLFYGYCRYFLNGKYDERSFSEWNRVLWNICENRVDKSRYKPTMKEIDMLAAHSHNILSYLSQNEDIKFDANKEQLLEEQIKARHLSDFPNIIEMEGYAFFKGAIRFLYTGDDNKEDWGNFNKKAENVKTLVPDKREERHTIKLLTPYLSEQSLPDAYNQFHWAKNTDEDLRKILLDDKLSQFIHYFLLQNKEKTYSSLLHQDILELCDNEISRDAYIQTGWHDIKYVWTNYSRASGYYHWNSFVIGNEDYKQVSRVIRESEKFEIQEEQRRRPRCGDIIQGLYLHFKYKESYFTLLGNNTVCRMTERWREKYHNPVDGKVVYFLIKGIKKEDSLINQIENIIKSEKD